MATKTATNGIHKPTNRVAKALAEGMASQPTFELESLRIKVVGVSPLLCHNPAGSMSGADGGGTTRGPVKKTPTPAQEAEAGCYRDEDGDFAFPNAAMRAAIITAAEILKLKVGTGRMAPSVSGILINGLSVDFNVKLVKLVDAKGNPLKKYEVDAQRVVIPASGSSVIRGRPSFMPWAATFDLLFDADDANLCAILSDHMPLLLKAAGMRVGIGDNRPFVRRTGGKGKPSFGGPNGRFSASVVE